MKTEIALRDIPKDNSVHPCLICGNCADVKKIDFKISYKEHHISIDICHICRTDLVKQLIEVK